jgi:hypothetical protein
MDSSPPLLPPFTYDMPMPRAGTLRNLFVRHNSGGGGGAGSITYTVFKNGAATALTVTLLATIPGTGSDTNPLDNIAVVAGDLISIVANNSGSGVTINAMVTLELA